MTDLNRRFGTTAASAPVTRALVLLLFLYLAAFVFAAALRLSGFVNPEAQLWSALLSSVILFAGQDLYPALVSAFVVILALRLSPRVEDLKVPDARAALGGLLAFLLILSILTRYAVMHNYDLTLDEYLPRFQAEIFLEGRLMAPLSPRDLELHASLQPFFTVVSETHGYWASNYRPVHAALLAGAQVVASADLLNPLLTVIAAAAMADIARQVFPDKPSAPLLATALLVASPQFVIMSGTGFAFPAHLAFNLVWLSLFLRDRPFMHIAAACVGFFAVGLHQVHFHLLFALPFGVAVLLGYTRTRWTAVPYILMYSLALAIWISWYEISLWIETGDPGVLPSSLLGLHYLADYLGSAEAYSLQQPAGDLLFLIVNLFRFVLWLSPALVLGALLALYAARQIGWVAVASGISVLVTIAVSHVLMPNQMQSWGGRYYHPVLGNLVIFAMAGIYAAGRAGDRARIVPIVATLLAVSILFVPWRLVQLEAKMGPRAAVQAWLETRDADVVVLKRSGLSFIFDWGRNGPFVDKRPIILVGVPPEISARYGSNILEVERSDLSEIGLPEFTFTEPNGSLSGG